MTAVEKQEIVSEVLAAIRTNSAQITDLTEVQDFPANGYIEISGGKRISIANQVALIQEIIEGGPITILAARVDAIDQSKFDKANVVESGGSSSELVMSQKGVTQLIGRINVEKGTNDGTGYILVFTNGEGDTSTILIGTATTSEAGLLSADDKTVLDALGRFVESSEWVRVVTDSEDKILYGIKRDGDFYFGGIPSQVQEALEAKVDPEDLEAAMEMKVDKVEGKGLSTNDYTNNDKDIVSTQEFIDSPEYIQVTTDSEEKVLEGIDKDGNKIIQTDLTVKGDIYNKDRNMSTLVEKTSASIDNIDNIITNPNNDEPHGYFSEIENPEWLQLTTDNKGTILEGIKRDGVKEVRHLSITDGMSVKGNIDTDASVGSSLNSPEYVYLLTDREGKVLYGIEKDGTTSTDKKIKDIDSEISDIDANLDELVQYESPLFLPDYYKANEYLDKKTRTISNYIRKASINGDAFFFVTDTHWDMNEKHSPAIIREINKTLNIHRLFHGGDLYQERNLGVEDDRYYQVGCLNAFRQALGNDHVYLADGNHEYIYDRAKWGDCYAVARMWLDDVVIGGEHKNYFYVDNKQKKIRYICYASFGEYINGTIYDGYNDQEQLDWIENVALDTEAGYSVIIFTHYTTFNNDGKVQWYYSSSFLSNLVPILNAYNESNKGKIIAVISGHSHIDYVDNATFTFPVIVSTCDNNRILNKYNPPRTAGTIEEQALDAVVFNKDLNVLHFVRLGCRAGSQAENITGYEYVQCRSIYYTPISVGNTLVLDTYLTGNLSWDISDNTKVSISGNTITALSNGNVRITATDTNGDKQAFYVNIASE